MHLLIVSYSLMLLSSILHALLPLPLCKKSEKEFSVTFEAIFVVLGCTRIACCLVLKTIQLFVSPKMLVNLSFDMAFSLPTKLILDSAQANIFTL